MANNIKHYSLNAKQLQVLKLIYKFRFINSSLLASYKGISRISTFKTLKILLDQGYIGKQYNPGYRLQGIGKRYYLAPKALRLLRGDPQLDDKTLLNMYKNRSISDVFISHNIDVFKVYLSFRDKYPDTFQIFTKSEMGVFTSFPVPKPDLYLSRIKPSKKLPNEFLLDIFTDAPQFIIKKRAKAYIEHYDSGEWEAEARTPYPAVLIVCPDSKIETNLQAHINRILDNMGIDGLIIRTISIKTLLEPDKQ
jgi:DNA-binding MarR family transcriptional regulator